MFSSFVKGVPHELNKPSNFCVQKFAGCVQRVYISFCERSLVKNVDQRAALKTLGSSGRGEDSDTHSCSKYFR